MPSNYIPKGQRTAKAAEEKALAVLQSVCDSDVPQSQKQQAASQILEFQRVREKAGPLRAALAERIKTQRAAERDRDTFAAELAQLKVRLGELEPIHQQFADAKQEIARLTAALSAAKSTAERAEQGRATAQATADTWKRTVKRRNRYVDTGQRETLGGCSKTVLSTWAIDTERFLPDARSQFKPLVTFRRAIPRPRKHASTLGASGIER